jgi:hypothetical protein
MSGSSTREGAEIIEARGGEKQKAIRKSKEKVKKRWAVALGEEIT